jgi:hypothetical protein
VKKLIIGEELVLMQKVCDAASDYLIANENQGFANEYGGVEALREQLFKRVANLEFYYMENEE